MQIKTYIDRDLESALARAHGELGPDALVLGSRRTRDAQGRPQAEITVGVERPRTGMAARESLRRLAQSVTRRGAGVASGAAAAAGAPPAPALDPPREHREGGPVIDVAVASLVHSGLSQDLATRFARIAGRSLRGGSPGRMAQAAERGVAALVPFGDVPTGARVLFVVGPPGAGKTTSVAKLAARAVEESQRPVVYAMADTERIGALAESRIYAQHIGCEHRVIDTPGDLRRTLDGIGRHARVMIDTTGIGATDDGRLAALGELRREARDAQVVLVVPSGLHAAEVDRVIRQFAPVRPTSVAFSKVDDGRRIGDLVTALARSDLPLSFMTNGHRVPDDLVAATPTRLAALMLRAGRRQPSPRAGSVSNLQESIR